MFWPYTLNQSKHFSCFLTGVKLLQIKTKKRHGFIKYVGFFHLWEFLSPSQASSIFGLVRVFVIKVCTSRKQVVAMFDFVNSKFALKGLDRQDSFYICWPLTVTQWSRSSYSRVFFHLCKQAHPLFSAPFCSLPAKCRGTLAEMLWLRQRLPSGFPVPRPCPPWVFSCQHASVLLSLVPSN